jgi:hypothetical protein
MSRAKRKNPHAMLAAQVREMLAPAETVISDSQEIPWRSATFSGARHKYSLIVSGQDAQARVRQLQSDIGAAEISLEDYLCADILITKRRADWKVSPPVIRIEIEALTVAVAYPAAPSARRSEAMSPAGIGLPGVLSDWRKASALSRRAISPGIESSSVGRANLAGGVP